MFLIKGLPLVRKPQPLGREAINTPLNSREFFVTIRFPQKKSLAPKNKNHIPITAPNFCPETPEKNRFF